MNLKIKIIQERGNMQNINKKDELVYLSFRPSVSDLKILYEQSAVKIIQVRPSVYASLSPSFLWICDILKIKIAEGDIWGFRTDMQDWIEIPEDEILEMQELAHQNLVWDDAYLKLSDRFDNFTPSFMRALYEMLKSGEIKHRQK